jgi:PhnB protein
MISINLLSIYPQLIPKRMASLNPYLSFGNNCMEAFEFYKSTFGGEFGMVMKFKDVPPGVPYGPDDADLLMHISLPIGTSALMGSDTPASMGGVVVGNNNAISVDADSRDHADHLFNGLSAGGQVTMPMGDTFWGSYFGMFTDKYGVNWMISYDAPKA